MKKRKNILLVVALLLLLAGCGRPESANSLYKYANEKYGECEIVSKQENNSGAFVVVHDVLQDFDYTLSSGMFEMNIDGSSFGNYPTKQDSFKDCLLEKVISNVSYKIDNVCNDAQMTYEIDKNDMRLTIYSSDENAGKQVATKCAEYISEQNLKNRLDGFVINVNNDEESHFGSIKLPSLLWRNLEDEKTDDFIEYAKVYTDYKAEFIRKELKTFADTGLDICQNEYYYFGYVQITDINSPITFYYFESSTDEEYYVCDFIYIYQGHPERYTNYVKN